MTYRMTPSQKENVIMRRMLPALAVVALVSLYAAPAQTLPCGRETDRIFYNDCGPSRTIVGEIYTDCDGNQSSWGTVTDFEERTITNCCTGVSRTTLWECGVQVGTLDT